MGITKHNLCHSCSILNSSVDRDSNSLYLEKKTFHCEISNTKLTVKMFLESSWTTKYWNNRVVTSVQSILLNIIWRYNFTVWLWFSLFYSIIRIGMNNVRFQENIDYGSIFSVYRLLKVLKTIGFNHKHRYRKTIIYVFLFNKVIASMVLLICGMIATFLRTYI